MNIPAYVRDLANTRLKKLEESGSPFTLDDALDLVTQLERMENAGVTVFGADVRADASSMRAIASAVKRHVQVSPTAAAPCPLPGHLPADVRAGLRWLARQGEWLRYEPTDVDGQPGTRIDVDTDRLRSLPGASDHAGVIRGLEACERTRNWVGPAVFDLVGRLLADGLKVFQPTPEQFESFEHVELHVPISDFCSPYPVVVVTIPHACRVRLSRDYCVPFEICPRSVTVSWRPKTDTPAMVVTHSGDPGLSALTVNAEVFYLFQDRPENATIEAALSRDATPGGGVPGLLEYGHVTCRAALNACLMLTHFGCRLGPLPPARNREERRARENDPPVQTITMQQEITIRQPPPPGDGVPSGRGGHSVKSHWRRGHWRAYPGQGALRASGGQAKLVLVRPCLVRPDRVVGDLGDSSTTYKG